MSQKWNAQETTKFVENYRKQQCLWDPEHMDYKNKEARDAALFSLTEIMDIRGFDIQAAKKKIRTIRSTYWNEITKISNSIKVNSGEEIYKPKLSWFPIAAQFLSKVIENNHLEKIIRCVEKQQRRRKYSSESSGTYEFEHGFDVSDTSPRNCKNPNITIREESESNSPHNKRNRIDSSKEASHSDDITFLENVSNPTDDENEFVIFGRSVGQQLQQLPLEDAVELQMRIQNMLTLRRLRVIKNNINSNLPLEPPNNVNHNGNKLDEEFNDPVKFHGD